MRDRPTLCPSDVVAPESANWIVLISVSCGNVAGSLSRVGAIPARVQLYILDRGLVGSVKYNMRSCQDCVRANNHPGTLQVSIPSGLGLSIRTTELPGNVEIESPAIKVLPYECGRCRRNFRPQFRFGFRIGGCYFTPSDCKVDRQAVNKGRRL